MVAKNRAEIEFLAKDKVSSTIDRIDRNTRKAQKNIRSENTKTQKSFGAFQGVLAGVGLAGVLSFERLASAVFSFSKSIIDAKRQIEPIQQGFRNLAIESDFLLRELDFATRGTVSNFDLMSKANNALLLGIDQEALPNLFKNAAIVGQAAGRSTSEAINDITVGIGRQSRLILDNLGIIVKAEDAYDKYAESIGKSASQLTEAEKRTAFTAAAIESLNKKANTLGGDLKSNLNIELLKLRKRLEDAKVAAADDFSVGITTATRSLNEFLTILDFINESTDETKKNLGGVTDQLKTFVDFFKPILDAISEASKLAQAFREVGLTPEEREKTRQRNEESLNRVRDETSSVTSDAIKQEELRLKEISKIEEKLKDLNKLRKDEILTQAEFNLREKQLKNDLDALNTSFSEASENIKTFGNQFSTTINQIQTAAGFSPSQRLFRQVRSEIEAEGGRATISEIESRGGVASSEKEAEILLKIADNTSKMAVNTKGTIGMGVTG